MCGRFSLTVPVAKIAEYFHTLNTVETQARYNIAPSQGVVGIRRGERRPERIMDAFGWGLIPHWAKDPAIGNRLTNARSETLRDKPSFRGAFKYRRCIIPADGFYEWQSVAGRKQPYRIHLKDQAIMPLAGLWEHWTSPSGSEVHTCTLITTSANEFMEPLHHRMPVILQPSQFDTWLDPQNQDSRLLEPMLKPCPDEWLTAYPVDPFVNQAKNEGPRCFEAYSESPPSTPLQGELF